MNTAAEAYFIVFILIGGLFTINLFHGVVISSYLNEKEKLSNNHLLTEMQREWIKTQIKCYKSQPRIEIPKIQSRLRLSLIKFTNQQGFEFTVYVCIMLNTVILACSWYEMPEEMTSAMQALNNVFTGVFSIEATLKIIGYGRLYFKKAWNVFDFFIIIITMLQILNSIGNFTSEFTAYATVLRVLKLLKTARLFKKASNFNNILKTMLTTIP